MCKQGQLISGFTAKLCRLSEYCGLRIDTVGDAEGPFGGCYINDEAIHKCLMTTDSRTLDFKEALKICFGMKSASATLSVRDLHHGVTSSTCKGANL